MKIEDVQYLRDPDGITTHAAITLNALTEPLAFEDPNRSGALAVTEPRDAAAFAGIVSNVRTGVLTVVEPRDSAVFGGAVTDAPPLAAPVLDWISAPDDTTPQIDLTHDDLQEGDTVVFQFDTVNTFNSGDLIELVNEVDAGEDAANAIDFTLPDPLTEDEWFVRARVDRSGYEDGDWSAIISETIDLTPAPSEDAATTAWVNAVVADGGTVSATQRSRVDALIVGLKADSLWTLIDRMWLYAGEISANQAKIDIKALIPHALAGTPTAFDVGGYDGDASTFYINSNFTPATHGVNWTLNSASILIYEQTNVAGAFSRVGSFDASENLITPRLTDGGGGYHRAGVNGGADDINHASGSNGCWIVSRTASNLTHLYRNGSSVGNWSLVSTARDTVNLGIFARGLGATFDNRSTAKLSAVAFTAGLNATQAANFTTRLNAYMTAWGVNQF
jgi:hypothetical protein